PENLLEAELFGHEKGAFTDARETKRGLAEVADQGTLFLDEIGSMPPSLQAKLLTFLESRSFRRLGGTEEIEVDLRVIAATNAHLETMVEDEAFREDLYFRLNVASHTLPPLRHIRSDIPLLARHFVRKAAEFFRKPVPELDPASVKRLLAYDWPGNVRELRNVIERAMIFRQGEVLEIPLPAPDPAAVSEAAPREGGLVLPLGLTLEEVEKRYIEATMEKADAVAEAAEQLGISRKVLWARRRDYGLLDDEG
ncbi:MAG: sigma-54-dependent Fis family transcriptional regulator, partial [Gemmatimonadetes bacterium]|nr:sigma-54-dependent Fis family transcriptional regulator [Gemmatimonadota bacterium]NIR79721.1 sigma-54-dependent Fis family transcriptional regulator [Gemmatimonadota bacterium]NIT89054.1 sigma-54-dependent Fis family transcriptional regulator [Gemmatimonadota bacterium]NIU32849.1 sigma-54-dependent Fis family transcriptional regulator [Gemmatimonadota bacterium]NIU37262.1 sigma-54-dependent Fis family transcriptional regulator [Gemmatimonadota bacterium]